MRTLTVTPRGQVTFPKDILRHLGVKPGEKIKLNLLSDGRVELRSARVPGSFAALRGILKDKTNGACLSIEEISDAIADAGFSSSLQRGYRHE
ncbi:MAG: AbrB/MazE/SpoVT family DNA-binding domain-containing protein [Pseudomonadales bacterium]|jgi:AbrB family looped-hinge helix DNA binding protein|nr:AbrB/MazE/SpoVT family DNA-binding domain-containing protein [Pseudomonadales bacterium]